MPNRESKSKLPEFPDFTKLVGPVLATALEKRGFTALTAVQLAVLDPKLANRDLRVSSQTGSGKTVAIGLAIRDVIEGDVSAVGGAGHPRALVVVPTRELAKQVEEELGWLLAGVPARVVSVTGGASYMQERRALASGIAVVVGTPGRLLDHLKRGSINPDQIAACVLDEADRMLDLGFREDLEAILGFAPADHLTHLMSATFPRDVKALADKVQRQPAHVEGTPLGTANADIDHVIHLVDSRSRVDAIVNLLLATPDAQTLVFARTRADVARITRELSDAGFHVASLSGEMEQPERNRALAAFKRGNLHALVATDVAARGIDVQDIARVIHAEPPDDADAYTHRSGRTGRAGKKGTSFVLVANAGLQKATMLMRRAGVKPRVEPLPTAASIRASADERIVEELMRDDAGDDAIDPRTRALADRIVGAGNATQAIARLLERARKAGPAEPREIRPVPMPTYDRAPTRSYDREGPTRSHDRAAPSRGHDREAPSRGHDREVPSRGHDRDAAPRSFDRDAAPRAARPERADGWVPFRVSWGSEGGADPRRLLALVCRRGNIRGADVGAIRIARAYAVVNVAGIAAQAFAAAASAPDPRDPRVTIRPEGAIPPAPHSKPRRTIVGR
jgi:ATP-dependent RNA helicase DeaD